MDHFDPWKQNITLLMADGKTPMQIPLPAIDAYNSESINICISYASQIGACFAMLLVVLVMTPSSNAGRPSNILHITCLVFCLLRNTLLVVFFPSPLNYLYPSWTLDPTGIAASWFHIGTTANVFSLLLTVAVELALMNQAWTMVTLWPELAKYTLSLVSGIMTLVTVSWKIAFTVVQIDGALHTKPPTYLAWIIHGSVITNILSISWFCAIFNIKLVMHLISNRGILPNQRALTPMEILVMTNGILMIFPVLFAGLEWGHFTNFEPGSFTLTLVALILPMGTLAAQRMAHSHHNVPTSSRTTGRRYGDGYIASSGTPPFKGSSFATSFATTNGGSGRRGTTTTSPHIPPTLTRQEAGLLHGGKSNGLDPIDVELRNIDSDNRDSMWASSQAGSQKSSHNDDGS